MLPEDNRFSNDPNEFWPEKLIDPLEGIGFTRRGRAASTPRARRGRSADGVAATPRPPRG